MYLYEDRRFESADGVISKVEDFGAIKIAGEVEIAGKTVIMPNPETDTVILGADGTAGGSDVT